MSLPLQIRTHADEEYVHQLRSAYAGMRLYEPSNALAEDPDIEEKMLRDPHIRACWDHRVRRVAGRKWSIVPKDETEPDHVAFAELLRAALDEIQNFTQARQELASSGIFRGRGYQYIASRRRSTSLAGFKGDWLLPTWLEDIDASRIRFDPEWRTGPDGRRQLRTVAKVFPLDQGSSEPVPLSSADAQALVHATLGDEEKRLGYGRGLMDSLYFAFYAKTRLVVGGLDSAERWARGLTVAKVDPEAHGGTAQTNAAIAQDFLRSIEKTRAKHVMAIDKRDDVTVLWPSGEGWRMFSEGVTYWDNRISSLILASVLPTGGGDQTEGSFARADTEMDSQDALIAGDREIFDGAWTRCLLGWFCAVNGPLLRAHGFGGIPQPSFRTGDEERVDPQVKIDAVKTAIELGAPVGADEFYEALGIEKPEGAPAVIAGKQQMAGMLPPGFGGANG